MKIANRFFEIKINENQAELDFSDHVDVCEKAGKTAGEMKDLLYEKEVNESEVFYDFYAGVADRENKVLIEKSGLRYDVIMVRAGTVNGEWKKTSGHKHIGQYPEIYEVLDGTALFLMQKGEGHNVESFAAVKTEAGEKILIPPGYTHATANIGKTPLIFSDLIAANCRNQYEEVKKNGGMCYYLLKDGKNFSFVKNPQYRDIPQPEILSPIDVPEMGLESGKPVYEVLCEQTKVYEYLSKPGDYLDKIIYLDRMIEERNKE